MLRMSHLIENRFHYKQVIPLQMGDNHIGKYHKGNKANCQIESSDPSLDDNHCARSVSTSPSNDIYKS